MARRGRRRGRARTAVQTRAASCALEARGACERRSRLDERATHFSLHGLQLAAPSQLLQTVCRRALLYARLTASAPAPAASLALPHTRRTRMTPLRGTLLALLVLGGVHDVLGAPPQVPLGLGPAAAALGACAARAPRARSPCRVSASCEAAQAHWPLPPPDGHPPGSALPRRHVREIRVPQEEAQEETALGAVWVHVRVRPPDGRWVCAGLARRLNVSAGNATRRCCSRTIRSTIWSRSGRTRSTLSFVRLFRTLQPTLLTQACSGTGDSARYARLVNSEKPNACMSRRHDNDRKIPRTLKEIYALNRVMAKRMEEIFTSRGIPVIPSIGTVSRHDAARFSP